MTILLPAPNDVAWICAEAAAEQSISFVADINDLWPEAMRMVADTPLVSDVAFYPFARDAKRVYELLSGAVDTSDEYAARPAADRAQPYPHVTVYVGNDLFSFDRGQRFRRHDQERSRRAVGHLCRNLWRELRRLLPDQGSSAPQAGSECEKSSPLAREGARTGPDREKLQALASDLKAPVDFLGYQDYERMAAYLRASDIVVNSLVKSAAQSITTKIGDYLASGYP